MSPDRRENAELLLSKSSPELLNDSSQVLEFLTLQVSGEKVCPFFPPALVLSHDVMVQERFPFILVERSVTRLQYPPSRIERGRLELRAFVIYPLPEPASCRVVFVGKVLLFAFATRTSYITYLLVQW
jgi:hypothetical protein